MLGFGRAQAQRAKSRAIRGQLALYAAVLGAPLRTGPAHVVKLWPIRTENTAEQRLPRRRDVAEAKSGTALKIRHGGFPSVRLAK